MRAQAISEPAHLPARRHMCRCGWVKKECWEYDTESSRVITDLSTNTACGCLTSQIGRDVVLSAKYGRTQTSAARATGQQARRGGWRSGQHNHGSRRTSWYHMCMQAYGRGTYGAPPSA